MRQGKLQVIKKTYWRHLVKPEILFLVGAVMANLPYLLWRCGYPVPPYSFSISYKPLYLWILGYIAFCLGTGFVGYPRRKTRKPQSFTPFCIHHANFRFFISITIFAAIIQLILICLLYGTLPIGGFFYGYDIETLNMTQEASGFGQLGLLTLTLFVLNALILIGIVSNIKEKGRNRIILWIAVIVVIFGSLFQGKTQGFFIFICFLLTGGALTGVNPINLFMHKFGFPKFSKRQMIVVVISLFFFLILLHGFTRFLRVGRYEEFSVKSSFDTTVAYLSTPLINMENQLAISGLPGSQFEISGLLIRLLPSKMESHFTESVKTSVPRLERTSPSGFLSTPHWYLGLWGMLIFMFIIGAVCKYFYIRSNKSLFCLLAYSQIAWTLIAAHTYNHFLILLFIPAPIIAFFILTRLVRVKHISSKLMQEN